jgi:hypothetical protein
VSLVAGRSEGGSEIMIINDEAHGARVVESGGGGGRETVNRKRKLSAVFLQLIQNPSYMSHVLLLCISFICVA